MKHKQKYESIKPSGSNRIIRPKDIPGRLLNMAFLSLAGDDFKLRLSAYHLLQTLCQKFSYNTFVSLLDTKGKFLFIYISFFLKKVMVKTNLNHLFIQNLNTYLLRDMSTC